MVLVGVKRSDRLIAMVSLRVANVFVFAMILLLRSWLVVARLFHMVAKVVLSGCYGNSCTR